MLASSNPVYAVEHASDGDDDSDDESASNDAADVEAIDTDSTSAKEDTTTNANSEESASKADSSTSSSVDVIAAPGTGNATQESADLNDASSAIDADVIATSPVESADQTGEEIEVSAQDAEEVELSPAFNFKGATMNFIMNAGATAYVYRANGSSYTLSTVQFGASSTKAYFKKQETDAWSLVSGDTTITTEDGDGFKFESGTQSSKKFYAPYAFIPGYSFFAWAGEDDDGNIDLTSVYKAGNGYNNGTSGWNLWSGDCNYYAIFYLSNIPVVLYDAGNKKADKNASSPLEVPLSSAEISTAMNGVSHTGYHIAGYYYVPGGSTAASDVFSKSSLDAGGNTIYLVDDLKAAAKQYIPGTTKAYEMQPGADGTLTVATKIYDINLFVAWEADQDTSPTHTVKFMNGAIEYATKTGKATDTIGLPSAPSKTGYRFDGWNTSSSANKNATSGWITASSKYTDAGISATATTAQTVQVHAIWTALHTVDFKNGATSVGSAVTGDKDATISLPAQPTAASGKYFVGWNTNATATATTTTGWIDGASAGKKTFGDAGLTSYTTPGSATLYAIWGDLLTITYYAPNAESGKPGDATVQPGSDYTIPNATPVRTGYKFAGWKSSVDNKVYIYGGATNGKITNVTTNIILSATWTEKTYNIRFYYDQTNTSTGTLLAAGNQTISWNTNITVPGEPTSAIFNLTPSLPDYRFAGWYTDKNAQSNGHPITGTPSGSKLADNMTPADFSSSIDNSTTPNPTLSFYAFWTPLARVTVTYNANGGSLGSSVPASDTILNGASYTIKPTNSNLPTREGYTFEKWSTVATGTGTDYSPNQTIDELNNDLTLFARWTPNKVTITFKPNGGSGTISDISTEVDKSVSLPTGGFTRDGFKFLGWTTAKDPALNASTISNTYNVPTNLTFTGNPPTATVEMYAVWQENTYTIKFDANGGVISPAQKTGYKWSTVVKNIADFDTAVRNNYTFLGWFPEKNSGTTPESSSDTYATIAGHCGVSSADALTNGITLYAHWEEKTYQVVYHAGSHVSVSLSSDSTNTTLKANDYILQTVGMVSGVIETKIDGTTVSNPSQPGVYVHVDAGYENPTWSIPTGENGGALPSLISGNFYRSTDNGHYIVNVSEKKYAYRFEYYIQDLDGVYEDSPTSTFNMEYNGAPRDGLSPATVGQVFKASEQNTRFTRTGFTYDQIKSEGSANNNGELIIADVASNKNSSMVTTNVLKIYYYRNKAVVNITFAAGSGPDGQLPTVTVPTTVLVNGVPVNTGSGYIYYGATVTVDKTTFPSATGFHFENWNTSTYKDADTSADTALSVNNSTFTFTMPNGDVTLVGTWARDSYTIKFTNTDRYKITNSYGTISNPAGNPLSTTGMPQEFTITAFYGDVLSAVPDVSPNTIEGLTNQFIGWKDTATGTVYTDPTDSSTSFKVTGNMTLNAYWKRPVAIIYNPGAHGTFTQVEGNVPPVTGADTDYAVPTFDSIASTGVYASAYPGAYYDTSTTNPRNDANPKGENGWTFIGWATTPNPAASDIIRAINIMDDNGIDPYIVHDSTTFYAIWEATKQQIIFLTDGKNKDDQTISVTGGAWQNSTYSSVLVKETNPKYGTNDSSADTSANTITLPTAADLKNPGYKLWGWIDSDGNTYDLASVSTYRVAPGTFNNSVYNGDPQTKGYGITFTPLFEQETVTITFTSSTGHGDITLLATSPYASAGSTTLVGVPAATGPVVGAHAAAHTGYDFVGWFDGTSATATQVATNTEFDYTPQRNADGIYETKTYDARFVPKKYVVTFNTGDANGNYKIGSNTLSAYVFTNPTPGMVEYGTAADSLIDESTQVIPNTGYRLSYWEYTMDVEGGTTINKTVNHLSDIGNILGTTTIVAHYAPKGIYKVTYNSNGGSRTPDALVDIQFDALIIPDISTNPIVKTGYELAGWYVQNAEGSSYDYVGDPKTIAPSIAFSTAAQLYADNNSKTLEDVLEITLYAKWTPKTGYIVLFDPDPDNDWVSGEPAISPRTDITWTTANLYQTGFQTLTRPGYTFGGWYNNANNKKCEATTTYGELAPNDTDPSITLSAKWTKNTYTLKYVDTDGSQLHTETVYWDTVLDSYYNIYREKTVGSISYSRDSWTYVNSENSVETANFTTSPYTTVADLAAIYGGSDTTSPLVLTVSWIADAGYTVRYWTIDFEDDCATRKTPVEDTTTSIAYAKSGSLVPGSALNYKALGKDLIDYEAAYSRPGYVFDSVVNGNIVAVAAGSHTYVDIYFIEKILKVRYDTTTKKPAGAVLENTPENFKNVGWNDYDLAPESNPTIKGYNGPVWNYLDKTDVTGINGGTAYTLGELITMGGNLDLTEITLIAEWTEKQVTITYTVDTPAAGSVSTGSETVLAVNAAAGTPAGSTVTELDAENYVFDGWFYVDENGIERLATSNKTITTADIAKVDGVYVDRTYTAKFHGADENVPYEVLYFLMDKTGAYPTTPTNTLSKTGKEGATIAVDPFKDSFPGFTLNEMYTGSCLPITNLQPVPTGSPLPSIKLYYKRNQFNVVTAIDIENAAAGVSELPDLATNTDYLNLSGYKYYDTTQTLPTVTVPAGWSLLWKINYLDETGAACEITKTNGQTFDIPAAKVGEDINVTAYWTRDEYTVNFSTIHPETGDNHGSISAGSSFKVKHGTTLDKTTQYDTQVMAPYAGYVFAGWVYYNDDKTNLLGPTFNPCTVVINHDNFNFYALWEETYAVTYDPSGHGSALFNTTVTYGSRPKDSARPDLVLPENIGNNYTNAAATKAMAQDLVEDGYEMLGWTWGNGTTHYFYYDSADVPAGITAEPLPATLNTNYAFSAIIQAKKFTLTFLDGNDKNGLPNAAWVAPVTGPITKDLAYGATTDASTFPTTAHITREGYSLLGWNKLNTDNSVDTSKVYNASTPFTLDETRNVSFIPVWTLEGITIEFKVDDPNHGGVDVDSVYVNSPTMTPSSIATAYPGFTFVGWFDAADLTTELVSGAFDGTVVKSGDGMSGTITLTKPTGGWAPKTYIAKFAAGATSFTVEYYLQNLDGSYDTTTTKFHKFSATSDDSISFVENTHGLGIASGFIEPGGTQYASAGYVFDATASAGTDSIAKVFGDGNSKMKIYYKRAEFKISVVFDPSDFAPKPDVSGVDDQMFIYGSEVSLPDGNVDGYTFTWTYYKEGNPSGAVAISNDKFNMPAYNTVVKGTWTRNPYTVVFIANGDDTFTPSAIVGTVTGMPNANPTADGYTVDFDRYTTNVSWTANSWLPRDASNNLVKPSRAGYDFDKWVLADLTEVTDGMTLGDLAGDALASTGGTIYIYAKWNTIEYNLFYVDSLEGTGAVATLPASKKVKWDDMVDRLSITNPMKLGYDFEGWYTNAALTNKFNNATLYSTLAAAQGLDPSETATTAPTKGVTLYANWTVKTGFYVTYNENKPAGATGTVTNLVPNSMMPLRDAGNPNLYGPVTWDKTGLISGTTLPTLTGYIFNGWTIAANGNNHLLPIDDKGLYSSYSYGSLVTLPSIGGDDTTTQLTFTANWVAAPYDITYVDFGTWTGNAGPASAKTNDSVTIPGVKKAGKRFIGWTSDDVVITGSTFTMPASNVTVTANWEDITYTVNYNDGAAGSVNVVTGMPTPNPKSVLWDATAMLLDTDPTRPGYVFVGWEASAKNNTKLYKTGDFTFSDLAYNGVVTDLTGDDTWTEILFTAKWTANTYNITYVLDGGNWTGTVGQTTAATDEVVTIPTVRRPGKVWAGWSTSPATDIAGHTFTMPASDVVATALWNDITYTVEFNDGAAGSIHTVSGMPAPYPNAKTPVNWDDDNMLTNTDPTREGFTFAGWLASSNGSTKTYSNGGYAALTYGGVIDDLQGEDSWTKIVFTAMWTANTYNIIYNLDGGNWTGNAGQATANTEDVVNIPAAKRAGKKFAGWTTAPATDIAGSTFTMPASDVTVTAHWEDILYKVNYNDGKGGNADQSTMKYPHGFTKADVKWADADLLLTTAPKIEGYTFTYWQASANGAAPKNVTATGKAVNAATYGDIVTALGLGDDCTEITLTAMWEINKYFVHFDANADAFTGSMADMVYTFEEIKALDRNAFGRDGYSFAGWNSAADGSGAAYADGALVSKLSMVNNDVVTMYAQWTRNVKFQVVVVLENEYYELTDTVVASYDYYGIDGETVSVSVTGNNFVVNGKPADGTTFAPTALPVVKGYVYDADEYWDYLKTAKLTWTAGSDGNYKLTLPYMPRNEYNGITYNIHYIDCDGFEIIMIPALEVNWATSNFVDDAPDAWGTSGNKFSGWYTSRAFTTMLTNDMTYGFLANGDETVTDVYVFANEDGCTYNITYIDAYLPDGTESIKYIASSIAGLAPVKTVPTMEWTSVVDVTAPAKADTNHTSGYKFLGWALSPDETVNFIEAGMTYEELAYEIGMDADMDSYYDLINGTMGLPLYAIWTKYVDFRVEYYAEDKNGNKVRLTDASGADATVWHYAAENEAKDIAWIGGPEVSLDAADINKFRPTGYASPFAAGYVPSIEVIDGDNVFEVVYKQIVGYVLNLDANGGKYGAEDTIKRHTGLTWDEVLTIAEFENPKRAGYTIAADPADRWYTAAGNRQGSKFVDGTAYGSLAQLIKGAGISDDDTSLQTEGITLYAQWDVKNWYKVKYDLNNDKSTNDKIINDVPEYRNPVDPDDLTVEEQTFENSGYDRYTDEDLDAAPLGYEFDCWNTEPDYSGIDITNDDDLAKIFQEKGLSDDDEEVKLYAKWKEIQIKINYISENENKGTVSRHVDYVSAVTGKWTPGATIEGDEADRLTSLATPKPGYHFVRWELVTDEPQVQTLSLFAARARVTDGGTNEWGTNGVIDEYTNPNMFIDDVSNDPNKRLYSATYRAIFDANETAVIKYAPNDGSGKIDDISLPHGTPITLSNGKVSDEYNKVITPYKRDHYTLIGWNTKPDGTGTKYALGEEGWTIPEGGTTLYAMWERNKYTVSIPEYPGPEGHVTGGTTTVTDGQPIPGSFLTGSSVKPEPKPGYLFAGWNYTVTDPETGKVLRSGTVNDLSELGEIEGNVTATPTWEKDPKWWEESGTGSNSGKSPKTGDDFQLLLTVFAASSAMMFLIFALLIARRRKEEEAE